MRLLWYYKAATKYYAAAPLAVDVVVVKTNKKKKKKKSETKWIKIKQKEKEKQTPIQTQPLKHYQFNNNNKQIHYQTPLNKKFLIILNLTKNKK